MESLHRFLITDVCHRRLILYTLKSYSLIYTWLHGLVVRAISDFAAERISREGDSVSFICGNLSSAENSVVWLYTPGEAYEGVQHIYTDGRMLSRWTSKCNVTTNATASTLVLDSVNPNSAGYYECSEEHFSGYDVRFRVKLVVSEGEGSTQNVDDIIDAFSTVIVISGTSAAVFLVACTLLILIVCLTQRRKFSKAMDRRIIQSEKMNCEKLSPISKIEEVAFASPLISSQSAKEHPPLPSDRMSFLKSDNYNLKAPEHEGA